MHDISKKNAPIKILNSFTKMGGIDCYNTQSFLSKVLPLKYTISDRFGENYGVRYHAILEMPVKFSKVYCC